MRIAVDCRFVGKCGIGTYIENIVQNLIDKHPENEYLFLFNSIPFQAYPGNVEVQIVREKPFSVREILLMDCSKPQIRNF